MTCSKLMVLLAVLAVSLTWVGSARAGIQGSEHDFSSQGWSGGKICGVCHTPHKADTSVSSAPLWNHSVTTATYTLYSSDTLNATVGQPSGASKLCLSCHDGTVAIDSFGGNTGNEMISGGENIGTDLSGTHPISFTYNAALANADGALFDPSTKTTALGGTIAGDLLAGGKMECSSCHDVHDRDGNDELLRISNTSSALCLTCHNK